MSLARPLGKIVALLIGVTAAPAWAQGNFEIQVYGSELTGQGQTMVELHSNTAIKARLPVGPLPSSEAAR